MLYSTQSREFEQIVLNLKSKAILVKDKLMIGFQL